MRIAFVIPGRVAGKQRPRFSKKSGTVYTPAKTVAQENNVGWSAKQAMGETHPFQGPVSVEINSWQAKPKSWSEKKKKAAIYVTGKPDCDNLAKLICDAMNGICYGDDSQICNLSVCRRYSVHGDEHVNVTVSADWAMP